MEHGKRGGKIILRWVLRKQAVRIVSECSTRIALPFLGEGGGVVHLVRLWRDILSKRYYFIINPN